MLEKFEQPQEHVISIHRNLDDTKAKSLLENTAKKIERERGKENLPDNHKLWLLRHSSVPGLVTFESIVYNKGLDQWVVQTPKRYMNSENGWVINNHDPRSQSFNQLVTNSGGKKDIITDENSVLIESLVIHIMESQACSLEDHITELVQKVTKVKATSRYIVKEESFSLPGYIANILICPWTKEKILEKGKSTVPLMKHPVVLKDDGKSYERDALVARYKKLGIDLIEGVHYYNNIVLKAIIGYLASQEKTPAEYLELLNKINDEVLIDSLSYEQFADTVISPSGFSFSKEEIMTYIASKKIGLMEPVVADPLNPNVKITKSDLIFNENLELFVRLWPAFYMSIKPQVELK